MAQGFTQGRCEPLGALTLYLISPPLNQLDSQFYHGIPGQEVFYKLEVQGRLGGSVS